MRRGRFLFAAAAGIAAMMVTAAGSFAATPRQIYADLAQHGKLTHHYSAADLKRAARDATLQGYGGVGSEVTRPVVQAAATLGTATQRAGVATTQSSGALPFTGLQLGVYAALGLAVLVGGLLLRRAGRRDTGV
jgi:hypothetical protein